MQKMKWRALEALGLGDETFSGELRVAALGNRAASLAGVKAIRRYAPDCLRVQVAGGMVQIDGSALTLRTVGAGVVEVCGRIESIQFEMDERGDNA